MKRMQSWLGCVGLLRGLLQRASLGLLFLVTLLTACSPSVATVDAPAAAPPDVATQEALNQATEAIEFSADPSKLDTFLDEAFFAQLVRDPELVSELGLAQVFGMDNSQLTNVSEGFQLETYALFQEHLDTLHKYDRAELAPEQQLSYDLFEWYLEDFLLGREFRYYEYPINQAIGAHHLLIEFMTDRHPIRDLKNAQDYIARLEQFATKFDQWIARLEIQEAQGITPPKFVIQHVINQLGWYLSQDAEDTALYETLESKILPMSSITPDQSSQLREDALVAIEKSVFPAYEKLQSYFNQLLVVADTDDGFWKHPNGDAAYAYWLRHHTTTDLSADEIHQLGLEEVARIQAEMEEIFLELGITGDSLAEKMNQVVFYGKTMPLRSEADRQAVLDAYQSIIDRASQNMSELFALRPQADVVVVSIYAPTAPGAYYAAPAMDGSRPGMFYVNLAGTSVERHGMPTLAYHEAVPGHHFQIAIQQELEGIPSFRNGVNYTAYAEGWALYAEYLAWEAGFYDGDPYGNLGRLQSELFRAARLVVDTGIHAMEWTRERAIDYMVDNIGYPRSDMTREVERYIVWPGQATAYKIGMIKILELRERAEEALGDGFDMKAFHNLILGNGAMPLEILERVVDDFITAHATP